jgi:ABC-type antimicrobial peptide transport system permease subunit
VVGDVRSQGLNQDPQPAMYIPQAQVPDAVNALNASISPVRWIVRTGVDLSAMAGPIQEEIRKATGLPVAEVRSMDEVVSRSTSRQRFNMLLMTVFGGAALLLAAIGIYGLVSYSVQQRTQEIGIRLALGAGLGDVRRMIFVHGLRLTVIGIALGVAAALALARLLSGLLYGVASWDPLVFVGIPLLLFGVSLVAVWRPALRASRVDPMSALRAD